MQRHHWLRPYTATTLAHCAAPQSRAINLGLWLWPVVQLLYSLVLLNYLLNYLPVFDTLPFFYDLIFLLLLILFVLNISSLQKLARGDKKGFPLFYGSALIFLPFSFIALYSLNLLAYSTQQSRNFNENIVRYSLITVAFSVVCALVLIIVFIVFRGLTAMPLLAIDPAHNWFDNLLARLQSWSFFFKHSSLGNFLFSSRWQPSSTPPSYGIFGFVWGTVQVTLLALALAVPLGLGCAIYIAEFSPPKLGLLLRNVSELLAGLPSVVYGFFGSILLVPLVRNIFPSALNSGFNAISGGIILAFMIVPTIINLSEVSLRAVPPALRASSLALGATQLQTVTHITIPAAISGILTSIVLGASRAIGETLAVLMVAGNSIKFAWLPIAPTRTLTMNIIAEMAYAQDDPSSGSYHLTSLFSTSIVLLLFILGLNIFLSLVRKRLERRFAPS